MQNKLGSALAFRKPFVVDDNPGIDYAFIEDLREYICLRLDRIDPCKESKEFRQQREKAALLYEKLKEMLPEDGQRLLLGYSEALSAAHYLETAMLGERAFLDGVRVILRALGAGGEDGT